MYCYISILSGKLLATQGYIKLGSCEMPKNIALEFSSLQ